jgi:hypothetical protein
MDRPTCSNCNWSVPLPLLKKTVRCCNRRSCSFDKNVQAVSFCIHWEEDIVKEQAMLKLLKVNHGVEVPCFINLEQKGVVLCVKK